jgi:archaemetzincin
VGAIDEAALAWLAEDIELFLEVPVKTTSNMPIPEHSFEAGRNQYHSTKILKEIVRGAPPDSLKVLGVIEKDLCIPILTFVYGEAQLNGVGALVSLARLRQEFYGARRDEDIFRDRLRKEALHELGHTFGLIHCARVECIMYLSNTILDVDRKGRTFCRQCLRALNSKIGQGRISKWTGR